MSINRRDLAPLFLAYGNAAFEAQHLESGLGLLLGLLAEYEKKRFPDRAIETLSTSEARKTLGKLFDAVKGKEHFTGAEERIFSKAIQERNFLIHRYWQDRIRVTASKEGRMWVVEDLIRIRDLMRKAHKIVDSLIDIYLREHGVQLADFGDMMEAQWESETEIPKKLMH